MESTLHLKTFNRLYILYHLFFFTRNDCSLIRTDNSQASPISIFSQWSNKTVSIRGVTKSSDKNYFCANLRDLILFSNNWRRIMKASSPGKLIWNLSFYPLSFPLSFLEICSWHFSVFFFIPASSTAFPRLVKKRRITTRSLFSGFRFVLSSGGSRITTIQSLIPSFPPSLPLSRPMLQQPISERDACVRETCGLPNILTHGTFN